MTKKLSTLLILLFATLKIVAQHGNADEFIGTITEELQENETPESTIEEITFTLTNWSEEKPNINTFEADKLLGFRLLTPMQAAELHDYRKKNGDILSPYELVYLPAFKQNDVIRLTWFFSFGKKEDRKKGLEQYKWGSHGVMAQYNRFIEAKSGYKDDTYEGNPGKTYFRYKYKYGQDLSIGITAEKDPGEAFFTGSNKEGFDYYSMHFYMKPGKYLKTIALGDFQTTLGQGLICGQGIWGGKNSATTQIRNTRQGFKPYSSATEYGFMRGAAVEGGYKSLKSGVFVSYQKIDATVDTLEQPVISSLSATGLHRTEGEIAKKSAVKEFITGGYVQGRFDNLKVNLNSIFTRYEIPVKRNEQLYDYYDPDGQEFGNVSAGYLYQIQDLTFFGEVAWSSNNALANIHGISFYPTGSAGLALFYRNYEKNYVAIHGYGLGESSGVQNEEGFYFGLEWLPFKYTQVNLYADLFRFPWLRYGEKAPTDGSEYLIDIEYAPHREINFESRFKYENKSTTVPGEHFANLTYGTLYKGRIQATTDYTPVWSGQTRLAFSHFNQDTASYNGWLLYYEHFYEPEQRKLRASVRINIFDVDDYAARIYTYERDVLYSFSVPSFQDTGIRYYLNLKWDALENLSIYTRIARTEYLHRDEVSSGNEAIDASHKTSLHAKVRWKF